MAVVRRTFNLIMIECYSHKDHKCGLGKIMWTTGQFQLNNHIIFAVSKKREADVECWTLSLCLGYMFKLRSLI